MSGALPERHGEQILATVLFADLVGFDQLSAATSTEKAYLAVTHLLRLLDGVARKYGGAVDKYLGDKLLAVFGHPMPLPRPEHAAVQAALEMRQHVEDYNREAGLAVPLGLHVGINSGELVSGDIRGPVVREFHVLGDAVNTAARINARAPTGEVWVGPSVHEAAKPGFRWRAIEPLTLKGKREPVAVFAVEGAEGPTAPGFEGRLGAHEGARPALVGRDAELARLHERLRGLAKGQGGVLQVTGPAGCGKSRLLAALSDAGELAALDVVQVHATAMLRGRAAELLAPVLPAGMSAQQAGSQRALGRSLVRALLDRTRERGVLFVLEDAHELDAEAAALVAGLLPLAAQAPVLFLVTRRPGDAADTSLDAALAAPGVETVSLGPLSADEARALAVEALGEGADEEDVALVTARGAGNPAALLRAAFLAPVLRSEREQSQQQDERSSEAERRRCVVVFADLSGFTAMTEQIGAERAYPIVAECLHLLDEAARAYGGTVDHYLGDCVMALFGVPRAIQDAPRAALNAAIEMRRRIEAFNASHDLPLPISVHTGVATGLGIAGDISGPMIREFAVMGDHVDRADAITHLAEPGEIRVDDATLRATRDVFDFSAPESFPLPGAAEPQPTRKLLSRAPKLHRASGGGRRISSRLVGRDREMTALRGVLGALADDRRGGVVSLSAEAGLGKSRLLAEVRGLDDARRATWLVGRALSNGRSLGYHPFADLLRSWIEADDGDDAAGMRQKLDAALTPLFPPDEVAETAPLLAQMLGARLSPAEQEQLESVQGDGADKLVRAAFVKLLRGAAARAPVVLVMEDLHWADLSSVELVESLLRLSVENPIVFLDVFRPGFDDTSGRVLEACRTHHAERHVELALEPLGADAARAMVKNLFQGGGKGGEIPQRTRAAIEERARGNPFYIEEVFRSLLETGAIEADGDGFRATEKIDSAVIPDTVQEAVMARVDRLDLRRRSVLQAAAVIGGIFHLEVLQEVLDDPDLETLLEELDDQDFIVAEDRTVGLEYAFQHPLIQEVTYDALLESRREELHRAVALATEKRLDDAVPGYCAMLAFHFGKGRDAARAEEYLFRAGDEASRAAASNEALDFFQQASVLYGELYAGREDPDKRVRLEKSLAIALLNRGRLIESVDHFDRAVRLLGRASPRKPLAMGLRFVANVSNVLARVYLGRLHGHRVAGDRDRELLDLMFRRAWAQSTTSPTAFLVDSTDILRTLSGFQPTTVPESAAIYSGVTAIFAMGGLSFDLSRRFLDVAREVAEAGGIDERMLYYRTLGLLHHVLEGDWSDAHAVDDALVDEGIREGRLWEASTYLDLDCHRLVYQGRWPEAWSRIEKLAEMVDLYENALASSARLAHTAFYHVERRELDAALPPLDQYYDDHAEPLFNLVALGTRARIETLRGDGAAARDTLARADVVMRGAGRVPPLHQSYVSSSRYMLDVVEAESAVEAGQPLSWRALRSLARSRRVALAHGAKVAWRRTEGFRLAGREAWLRGRREQAVTWWERAIECAEHLGAQPERARTLADAGRALARAGEPRAQAGPGGRDATACLDDASRAFESLGLTAEREAVTRLA